MKLYLTLMLFFVTNINLFSQSNTSVRLPDSLIVNLPKTGLDESDSLNKYEVEILNYIFKDNVAQFDFLDKKIIMLSGNRGKKNYFNMIRENASNKNIPLDLGELYVLDKNDELNCKGVDAVIIYWSKIKLSSSDVLKKVNSIMCKNLSK
ncbi:hypothetical protein [Sphingobacterium hungaricum]